MAIRTFHRLKRWFAGISAAALLTGGVGSLPSAMGQDKDQSDLLRRLEKLERDNTELRQKLQEIESPISVGAGAVVPGGGSDVKKVVDDYLKEKDARTKAADAAKKKEIEENGFTVGDDFKLNAKWDHGLWLESADKAFKVHVGGRTQFDTIFYNAGDNVQYGNNGVGRVDDAFAFRRARFAVEGTFWEVIDFNMEYDFLNTDTLTQNVNLTRNNQGAVTNVQRAGRIINTPVPTDLWVQATHLPGIGNVRIGNFKAPFSFEHMTSSRFLNFIERSYGFDAFAGGPQNGFEPGVMVFNNFADDRLHAAASVTKFNQTIFGFNTGDGELALTGRLGAFPIWEDEGKLALWVGCGYRHIDPDFLVGGNRQFTSQTPRQVRIRARTELRNGPAELHTPLLDIFPVADSQDLVVPEMAFVCGPWSVVSEYYGSWLHGSRDTATSANRGTTYTQSAYVEVQYFLTGEHRVFNRKTPGFTRVVPHENFWLTKGDSGPLLGRGAWQIGARYSWIDLSDKGLLGGNNTIGSAQGMTLGLNWFLNPNLKLQWNYTYEQRYQINTVPANSANAGLLPGLDSNGALRGFGMRMAMDF